MNATSEPSLQYVFEKAMQRVRGTIYLLALEIRLLQVADRLLLATTGHHADGLTLHHAGDRGIGRERASAQAGHEGAFEGGHALLGPKLATVSGPMEPGGWKFSKFRGSLCISPGCLCDCSNR